LVFLLQSLQDLVAEIERHQKFCFDFETTSLNPRQAKIVGVALSTDQKTGYYIPLLHQDLLIQQLPSEEVFKILKPLFANPQILKIAQNLKYDWSVLTEQTDLVLEAPFADTMIGDYVIDVEGRHSMDVLAMKYLGYTCLSFEEVCGKGKNQITFDQVSIEKATRYSAEDAWVTFCLWEQIAEQLKQKNLVSVYETIDLPLVKVLMKMELTGVTVDQNFLKQLSVEFDNELQMIEKKILAYVPQGDGAVTLNLNSPKQLSEFLFEQLKLPPQSKTKTGYSTDADVLTKLAPLHEVPRLLLEYREISKLKGTYVDPIPLLIDTRTQKVHAGFHQTVAATGRLSSSDPNLQNIPIRSERGLRIRNAFIASEGFTLCSADYSQIELRILAHMSGDPDLEESFKLDLDVHRRTAAEIFSKPQAEINDEERSIAKAINFGLMYGKTPFGLAQELGIPQSMAKEMIERYFKRYHGVKVLLDRLIQKAKELGYAETLSGRRRLLPDLKAKNPMVRQFSERMAMNTPIQGTASDLMKIAMIRIDQALENQKLKSRLIIQVHDEVILEVAAGEESVVEKLVRENMESAMTLSVPLKVNMSFGKNWKEL
jgi:DNA polymerase-1